jgi:hypothetical protein
MNSSVKVTAAVIYLKSGKRKYGLLLNEHFSTNSYQFISNNNVSYFNNTQSNEYVEIVPTVTIESIEVDLK